MSTSSSSDPVDASADDSVIDADESWKEEVKAENASFDETLKTEAQQTESTEPQEEPATADESVASDSSASEVAADPSSTAQMPPASFEALVSMFSTQAMVALGVLPNPMTGEAEKYPELAKHFIDLLGVVETKTEGNLQQQEKTLLDTTLHHLRMAYMEVSSPTAGGDETT